MAASTGVTDCVMLLANSGADMYFEDGNQRGALQLGMQCQGKNQPLKRWLRAKYPDLELTHGKGRAPEYKCRGTRSYIARCTTGPIHFKGKGNWRQYTGYQPHGGKGQSDGDSYGRKNLSKGAKTSSKGYGKSDNRGPRVKSKFR